MNGLGRVVLAVAILAGGCGGGGDGQGGGADAGEPGAADGGDVRTAAWVFDESVIRTYDITVADADWQWLQDNATLEQFVPATVEIEGEVFDEVGVRYKGGFGSLYSCFDGQGNRLCDKLSIKLEFNEYQPGRRLYGLKRVNFHAMETDPSKMHDAIGYRLFREAGVFAPRTAFAMLRVNGAPIGLYAVIEQIDGRFTRARFPDGGKGNLYKEVWPVHATEQPYLGALETNEDESPSADKMVRFATALSEAGDAGFVDTLEAWTDVGMLMDYLAVARLIDHWDGIVGWYCVGGSCFNHNYYWYESTDEDRVWLIPWDLDHTFEEPSPIRTYYGMPDWDEVDASCDPIPLFAGIGGRAPACDDITRRIVTQMWDRYADRSQALLDGDFSEAALGARIDELEALLAGAVAADPLLDEAAWRGAVEELRQAVPAKRAHVADKL